MFLNYEEPLYRPPAEANSLILQVTFGCSFNNCAFCSMYEAKEYKQKNIKTIKKEIESISSYNNTITRVFLADGDALSLKTNILVEILDSLNEAFPNLRRVSIYASAFNLLEKSFEELELLRSKKLSLIYYGIESGSFEVLKKINKPISNEKMIEGLNKASKANIKISATVILGVAGKALSSLHIKKTAELINQTTINYLSTLQLILDSNSYLKYIKNFGVDFEFLDDKEMLEEQKKLLKNLNPTKQIIFRSNHASNSLALAGNLPKDKQRLIKEIEFALTNENTLIPSFLRGF
ncbi:radical SAM protein [Malaciobacter mytili]|uniref:radical SAM protein n=1 Tax=Malaciobacter mytili TaxID=603050 RepID=UPI003BAF8232